MSKYKDNWTVSRTCSEGIRVTTAMVVVVVAVVVVVVLLVVEVGGSTASQSLLILTSKQFQTAQRRSSPQRVGYICSYCQGRRTAIQAP